MKVDNIKNSTLSYKDLGNFRYKDRERNFGSSFETVQAGACEREGQVFNGFFQTLKEQPQEYENPYALRDDLIKPLPPEGHLVKTNLFNAPKHFVDGLAYDLKALKKGANGTANDHELGKLNNIGLVTGGTALATYLATRKQVASSKAMEFVGITSFLASMSLWPIVAIQIPSKLIHGFNVRQHYKDSMGREKLFFNDPQYLPWDLYSDEQINNVGDYMNVPKDMNNRRDYIQEKMKKVATQDNTLWMLSAGFAVPVMSALICNAVEQPVRNLCAYFKTEKNKNFLIQALDAKYDAEGSEMYRRLDSVLVLNNGKPLTDGLVGEILDIVGYDTNTVVNQKLRAELTSKLKSNLSVLSPEDGEKCLKILEKNLSRKIADREALAAIVPNLGELSEWLKEGGFIDKEIGKGDFVKLNSILSKKILEKLAAYNAAAPEGKSIPAERVLAALNNKITAKNAVLRFRSTRPAMVLNEQTQGMLRNLVKELVSVDNKSSLVKNYIFKELSAAQETTLANVSNRMTKKIFEALNISWKDMDSVRSNRDLMKKLLRYNMDRIAADKTQYENVMKQLADIAHSMDQFDKVVSKDGNATFFEQTINHVLNPAAEALEKLGFTDTARALAGDKANSEKSLLKSYAANRLMSIKSTIYRLINNLDMHRRIATMTNINSIRGGAISREVKEEIVELSKYNMVSAHRSDYAIKFFFNGNPHPDYSDMSEIEVKDGKVVNRYYKAGSANYRDVSADPTLYKGSMRLMYQDDILPKTKELLGDKLGKELNEYRDNCLKFFGDEWYFIKPESFVSEITKEVCPDGKINYVKPNFRPSTNKFKYTLTGLSLDDMAMKFAKQKHNSRAWLKLFGGLGIGIFTATVAAQFFFGKTPKPKEQVKS